MLSNESQDLKENISFRQSPNKQQAYDYSNCRKCGQKSGLDPWVFPKFDSGNLGNSVFQKAATVGFQSLVPRVTPAPSHVSPWLASRDSQRFRLEPVCPPGSQFDGAKTGCYYRFIGRTPLFFLVLACMSPIYNQPRLAASTSLLRVMFYCFRIPWISSDQDSLFNKTTSSLLGVFVERERGRDYNKFALCPTLM